MSDNVTSAVNQQGSPLTKKIGHDPSETTRRIPKMSRELAVLIGLLFTDGGISPRHKASWRIYFDNMSKNLIDEFKKSFLSEFNLDERRVRLKKSISGMHNATVDSKEIGTYLNSRFGTFRTLAFSDGTLPKAKLPVRELMTSGFTKPFLQAAFSCDGGVSLYPAKRQGKYRETRWLIRSVFLSCSHSILRSEYMDLLRSLRIDAKNVPLDGKIKIETEKGIKSFHRQVGFMNSTMITRHSKFWHGREKQHVLELLTSSYGNPSSIYNLPQFNFR